MTDSSLAPQKRDSIKSSVGNLAGQRRRQNAVAVAKERREALVRTKRLCRVGVGGDDDGGEPDTEMMLDEEQSILEAQTTAAVEELRTAVSYQGKGAQKKRVSALRELRRLLCKSEFPPVDVSLKAGAIPVLVQSLSFGSPDEQLLEAAWCLTNIAAGLPEETRSLLPALPLLIAHLGGVESLNTQMPPDRLIAHVELVLLTNSFFPFYSVEKSSLPVAEQCAWALGNVAGEGEDLRNVLLSQGALLPLARLILPDKGSTVKTAAWALSNLIKGPNPRAAMELIKMDGVLDAIIRHLRKSDEELATEVAWVAVYLTALTDVASDIMMKSNLVHLLVERLSTSNSLQLLIPVLRSLGNLVASDASIASTVLISGSEVTDKVIGALSKCLGSEHRVLKKEAAWMLSNIAAVSIEHKKLVYNSEAIPSLLHLLSTAPFDVRKEVAYVLGNTCVAPTEGSGKPNIIVEHLVSLVNRGCLPGFIDLVRSADVEAARLGLQFMELVLRGMPNGEGPKLVEGEDGIEAMERFQFHENEDLRNMANGLVDTYFGEDYGLEDA